MSKSKPKFEVYMPFPNLINRRRFVTIGKTVRPRRAIINSIWKIKPGFHRWLDWSNGRIKIVDYYSKNIYCGVLIDYENLQEYSLSRYLLLKYFERV